MGAGQSTSQSHPPSRALHILRVTPSSPASQTNIEPFFDFVVGFDGETLASEHNIDASELEQIDIESIGWSSKNREVRVVPIIPSRGWSQTHASAADTNHMAQPSLLGLSMRMCEPEFATDNVWHVLDVMEGSPAESAGLVPMGDWILGWSGGVLSAENDFYDLVEAHVDKPLRVYVYSHDFDALREVVLIPNRHWGGEGLLGCVFGFGLLHRIPAQPTNRVPGATPPELQENLDEYQEEELFVPADTHPQPLQPYPQQAAGWRRQGVEQMNQGSNLSHNSPAQEPSYRNMSAIHEGGYQNQDLGRSNNNFGGPRSNAVSTFHNSLENGTHTSTKPALEQTSYRQLERARQFQSEDSEDDSHDGATSVTGAETTSRGSLTSVE
ncbi:GRASP55/65 PDZ-like domain-containing protein [Infundibulicybe gibba]|nr:GRASP55/65 PDZ-like domain-containing protein [Infundibulicybe gibba]